MFYTFNGCLTKVILTVTVWVICNYDFISVVALQPVQNDVVSRLSTFVDHVGFRCPSPSYLINQQKLSGKNAKSKVSMGNSSRNLPTSFALASQFNNDIVKNLDVERRQILATMLAATVSTVPFPSYGETIKTLETISQTKPLSYDGIIVPPLDDREYVTYTLPNQLRVLLCSDPSSSDAAAAMDVHVGACSDPSAIPGLAHFNEHMLFLGTKKFPKEDAFGSFLATNGGSSNAYTDSENTVYYFDMNVNDNKKFTDGLVRFGSFFSSPLFTESSTERELNAIESENSKNLQSDSFRLYQMDKARANQDHPFSKFFTGNKMTLLEDTKRKGLNLREELLKFYESYYSANQMTLAIVAPQSIDELKKMVEIAFSDIPNRNVDKPEDSWAGVTPFSVDRSIIPSFNYIVELVPVKDLRQLSLKWPIVYRSDMDLQTALLIKPSEYVAHLVGHEGPKSLLSYLKRKGWANGIGAATNEDLSDFEIFEVVISLTPQGLIFVDEVIEAVYSCISLLRESKMPDYVFKEVLQLEELQWRFLTKGSPRNYVTSLSSAMQRFPPQLYVAGPRRLALDEYAADPQIARLARASFPTNEQLERTRDRTQWYVDQLEPTNAILTVISKTFEGQTDQKERWYGTEFRVRSVEEATLNKWSNCRRPAALRIDFPRPNQFIPTESGLRVKFPPPENDKVRKDFEKRMEPIIPPRLVRDDGPNGRWTVYFKEDMTFGKPVGFIVFEVLTKEVFASPMNAALSNLFELSAADRLREYAYDGKLTKPFFIVYVVPSHSFFVSDQIAGLAGLVYEVQVVARGVRLTFGGYNDKLKKFASFLTRKLSKEASDLLPRNDNDFDRYKDQIMRSLSSFDSQQPYAHASYYAQLTLQPRRFQYSNKELREATRKTTLPDLVTYVNSLWVSGKGEALIQGNFNEAEALDLVKSIGDVLPFQPISPDDYPVRLKALPLPPSEAFTPPLRLLVPEPNQANENSVSYVMLQSLERSEKDHVLIELLNAIIEEPFYDELRTKKQLGYIVAAGVRGIEETRTLSFLVQSNVAPAEALTIEILSFLDRVESNLLSKLSNGDLAMYVKSLIEKKTEPDLDLRTEVTRNWSEIASGRLQFDRRQREALALLEVEKDDLLQFWRRIYFTSGRRVLVTEVIPRTGAASSPLPPSSTGSDILALGLDDIARFRSERERQVYNQAIGAFPEYSKGL